MKSIIIIILAAAWLLPNHYPPWNSFHNEALSALTFWITVLFVTHLNKTTVTVNKLQLGIFIFIVYVIAQYYLLKDLYVTQMLFPIFYLTLFCVAITFGNHTKKNDSVIIDFYIPSFLVAGLSSFYLQSAGWLNLLADSGIFATHTMGFSGDRPYANLGQPNHLATLLIWAILSSLHLNQTQTIGNTTVVACVITLSFGIALTQSRAAVVSLFFIMLFAFYLTKKKHRSYFLGLFSALVLVQAFSYIIPFLESGLLLSSAPKDVRDLTDGGIRLVLWQGLIEASFIHPWIGWGLREIHPAIFSGVDFSTSLGSAFGHSHNIFLDLILWFGYPIALLIVALFSCLIVKIVKFKHGDSKFIFCALAFLALGIHSLFEYPHHYLYFLLPAGVFLGFLYSSTMEINIEKHTGLISRPIVTAISALSITLIVAISYSYLVYEEQFRVLRFEARSIGINHSERYTESFIFDQFVDFIDVTRHTVIKQEYSEVATERLLRVVNANPTVPNIIALSRRYAGEGNEEASKFWKKQACVIGGVQYCD